LTRLPDDSDTSAYTHDRMFAKFDPGFGLSERVDVGKKDFETQAYRAQIKGPEQHAMLRILLFAMRGRGRQFWLPTFFSDFRPLDDLQAGSRDIRVHRNGYWQYDANAAGRLNYVIWLHDGTRRYGELAYSTLVENGVEVLRLPRPLAETIRKQDIARISFMSLARLDQDTVTIEHRTDITGVSTVGLVFRTLPVGRAETGWNRCWNRSWGVKRIGGRRWGELWNRSWGINDLGSA